MNYMSNIARSAGDPKILRSGPGSMAGADKLAKALGWFSIGLGLAELIAPGRITRALGMEGQEGVVRTYGAREIASGIMTLSPDKHAGLCSRVAGDGLDLLTLLAAWRDDNPKRENVALAMAMVMGVTLLDLVGVQGTAVRHSEKRSEPRRLYHDRSGFPKGIQASRGAAKDFLARGELRPRPLPGSAAA